MANSTGNHPKFVNVPKKAEMIEQIANTLNMTEQDYTKTKDGYDARFTRSGIKKIHNTIVSQDK